MDIKPTITFCIPSKNEICATTVACLFNITAERKISQYMNVIQSFCIGQSDLPKLRSEQLSLWYKTAKKGDMFMFIDADQTFTSDDILTSIYHAENADIVCGAYSKKDNGITVVPKDMIAFYDSKLGELMYGSTGFMLIKYDIVDKLAKVLPEVYSTLEKKSYPFFYERIIDEAGKNNLWLGEDYSFCWLARQHGAKIIGYISPTIGHIVPIDKYVHIPKKNVWADNSIVIYCGKTAEKWSPDSLKIGIGGSELAIIKLAELWNKKYNVTVFCNCTKPGIYNNVSYRDYEEFSFTDKYNIVIIWRQLELLNYANMDARKCLLDLHDLVTPDKINSSILNNVTKICVKSNYHASLLGNIDKNKYCVIPNGWSENIIPENIEIKRNPYKLIYASSYDRGLAYMLKWGWPLIKKEVPQAELYIYYGWNGFDAGNVKNKETELYKQIVQDLMKQEGVFERGRIPQEELYKEKLSSSIHYYTGDFQEIDCISIRESACLGVIPVVSDYVEVFKEKSYCIRIEGNPIKKEMQETAARKIIELLKNPEIMEEYRRNMKIPQDETWLNTSKKWEELFN